MFKVRTSKIVKSNSLLLSQKRELENQERVCVVLKVTQVKFVVGLRPEEPSLLSPAQFFLQL